MGGDAYQRIVDRAAMLLMRVITEISGLFGFDYPIDSDDDKARSSVIAKAKVSESIENGSMGAAATSRLAVAAQIIAFETSRRCS